MRSLLDPGKYFNSSSLALFFVDGNRFGKRYDSGLSPSEQRSLLEMLHQAAVPLSSSVKQLNDVFSENQPIGK